MPNPVRANWSTKCEGCGDDIDVGESLWFTDEGKLCTACAVGEGYVCDCGEFKKPDFDECYGCAHS